MLLHNIKKKKHVNEKGKWFNVSLLSQAFPRKRLPLVLSQSAYMVANCSTFIFSRGPQGPGWWIYGIGLESGGISEAGSEWKPVWVKLPSLSLPKVFLIITLAPLGLWISRLLPCSHHMLVVSEIDCAPSCGVHIWKHALLTRTLPLLVCSFPWHAALPSSLTGLSNAAKTHRRSVCLCVCAQILFMCHMSDSVGKWSPAPQGLVGLWQ